MLERLFHARLLVPANAPETKRIRPLLDAGSRFADTEILACVQALEDTDLYRVRISEGETAALKFMRPEARPEVGRMFDREAFILRRLAGTVAPALLREGVENGWRYLLLSWCAGPDCGSAAGSLRASGDNAGLLRLAVSILDAYARIHANHVIHSDVHPRNILVGDDGTVHLIDFGLARVSGVESEFRQGPRGGIGYFFEPEYAKAVGRRRRPPPSTMSGEQYSVAALLYFLFTGKHYAEFSLEKHEMLRQIAEDAPVPFLTHGREPWSELEEVLARALAKDAGSRYASVNDFSAALGAVQTPTARAAPFDPGPGSFAAARESLKRVLDRLGPDGPLFRSSLAAAPRTSITYGSAGIASALHRIACARQDARLLSAADLWTERAVRDARLEDAWYCPEIEITPEIVGRVSPYHTESGVQFVRALTAHAMGDMMTQQNAVDCFVAAVSASPCDNLDLTLGRSGVLLAAAHLLAAFSPGSIINVAMLRELGNATMASIWKEVDSYPPILECRQVRYSGIAHGWAGMIYASLSWCRASGSPIPANAGERLNQLAALARPSGRQARWSWNITRHPDDAAGTFMGGWCNGTAGQVFLWLGAHTALRDDRYFVLAEKAAWHAAETESLIGSLCCGYSGQAYALLAFYRHSGDRAWLHRAQALAEKASLAYRDMPAGRDTDAIALRPDSLYKGELGVAVLAADLEDPEAAALPAFEFMDYR